MQLGLSGIYFIVASNKLQFSFLNESIDAEIRRLPNFGSELLHIREDALVFYFPQPRAVKCYDVYNKYFIALL